MITRALSHAHPTGSVIAAGTTAAWFLAWLARDNLQFKKEVAEQRQRLAERKAALRAAQDARLRDGPTEPKSQ